MDSPARVRILLVMWALALATQDAMAQKLDLGGTARYWQFLRGESLPDFFDIRRDSEFSAFRLTFESEPHPLISFEAHAVLDSLSPPATETASTVTGTSRTWLPLEHDFTNSADYDLAGRFDRLNLQVDTRHVRIKAGRQAITWGVTFFWPVMDLFSSFAPERIDRDFKEGVDALRVTVPLGAFSEVQVVGAVLGPSFSDDGSLAAQARLHLGRMDVGLMGGKFHRDTVAGAFFTTDAGGTAVRGEVTWTQSGDPLDLEIDRGNFWRASLGLDRQFSPNWGGTVEFSYNGFGAGSASEYQRIAQADRVRRGEVNALGTYYTGGSLRWQAHPLWSVSHTVLVNWQDPSAFYIPAVQWSASDNSTVRFGLQTGFGAEFGEALDIKSEYGPAPATAFAAIIWYF